MNKVEIKENDGRKYLLELDNQTRQKLIKKGANIKPIDEMMHGGIEHRYWNHKIAEINKSNGYNVELEKKVDGNGFVDQVVSLPDKSIAIEIETGKSQPVETIKRDLKHGFDKVVCVATNEKAYNKIKDKMKNKQNEGLPDRSALFRM